MAGIVFDHVVKRFGPVTAVDDLSLEIGSSEFVVLVGPSGCGKTTALRMLAGLEALSAGHISIGDRVVDDLPPRSRDVAMVFQDYALYPQMSVYKNLAFALQSRKTPKAEVRAAGARRRMRAWASTSCSTASRGSSPAASASASRWAGPWCATRRRS